MHEYDDLFQLLDTASADIEQIQSAPEYQALNDALEQQRTDHARALQQIYDTHPIHAQLQSAQERQSNASAEIRALSLQSYQANADKHPHPRITIRTTPHYLPSHIPSFIRALAQHDDKLITSLIKALHLDNKAAKHASEILNLPIDVIPSPTPVIAKKKGIH